MKTIQQENMEIYLKSEDRKIKFKIILYVIILVSLCCIVVFDKYRDLRKSNQGENKTLQNMEFSGK